MAIQIIHHNNIYWNVNNAIRAIHLFFYFVLFIFVLESDNGAKIVYAIII